ncbi:ATP-binding protein, partial [Nocardioides sp.]|uniref:ATP-binding protein n=1 Tax=Nocardioides sp. TaxID=35761 RepID=UPI00286E50F3
AAAGAIGAANVHLFLGAPFTFTLRNIAASHTAAILVIVPAILFLHDRPAGSARFIRRVRIELLAQVAVAVGVVAAVFAPSQELTLAYAVLPLFTWAALRFTPLVLAWELVATGIAVTLLTSAGNGPFSIVPGTSPATAGALVQSYLIVCVIGSLPLAVAVAENRRALSASLEDRQHLARERDLTDAVLDAMESLIVVLDHQGIVLRVNRAVERLTGLGADALVGRPFAGMLVRGEEFDALRADVGAGHTGQGRELLWRDRDSAHRQVICTVGPLMDGGGGEGSVVAGVEVSTLRRTENLLRSVLDATTGTPVIGTDASGVITFFNRGAELLLGYSSEDLVGVASPELFHDAAEVEARARELGIAPGFEVFVHEASANGVPERRDWTYVTQNSQRVTVSLTVTAMRDVGGRVSGYLGVAEDVTERRAAEDALAHALEQEREAVQALHEVGRIKSAFVSSTSHELRTPLTSVLGFTQLLENEVMGPVNDQQRRLLEGVERGGRRLLELIENLLTLSQVESHGLEVDREPLDLRDVVAEAIEATKEVLRPRDLELVAPEDPPPAAVTGDRQQLERAVINLITNAIKFTEDGGRITVAITQSDQSVAVAVSDTGIGIPPAEQSSLFTRFFRSSTAQAAAIPGTGLGLSIVREIVDAHDGTIEVMSRPGQGTTMTMSFPRDDSLSRATG